MRDVIAMLDGYNVSPSEGGNYSGGGAYPDAQGFPTLPSGGYGLAAASSLQAEVVEPGGGQNYVGGGAYPDGQGFPTLVSGQYGLARAPHGLASYMRAFATGSSYNVSPSEGGNYSGGGAYPDAQGFPTLPSGGYGLAAPTKMPPGWVPTAVPTKMLPVNRLVSICRSLLAQYGRVCTAGGQALLFADAKARYTVAGSKAALAIYARFLQSAIVSCAGYVPTSLQQTARRAVAMAFAVTGSSTNA